MLNQLHHVEEHTNLEQPATGKSLTKKERFEKDLRLATYLKYGKSHKGKYFSK